ncbi:sporulation protein YhbH [Ectothiorhodospiraceae bacterium 2226]|nr:sporulation protein YhbH [Ectothiorhodospiraceae bacterium 2226]
MAIFRPYSESEALRSDRSAGDRQRHRQKVREAIRGNIADIVAEESIIGQSRDKIIKVPIRGIKEYRFVYGDNSPGAGTGTGDSEPGQVIGKADQEGEGAGAAGNQPGVDYYETDVTLEELIEIMFEDLELPAMERKRLREVMSERLSKRKGFRKVGVRVHLDKRRTAIARLRRRMATRGGVKAEQAVEAPEGETQEPRFPFHRDDMTYKRLSRDIRPQSNAVVMCIMDTSGSMDTLKKYLARSFFFLLYQFVRTKYANVEVVFIAHHTAAREVSEEEFFHKGESGGTLISSGYNKALEIIQERYHPSLWNIYAFHCSDGDNWASDNAAAVKAARELCSVANLFGYGEIKPLNAGHYESSMLDIFDEVDEPNFHSLVIERKEDIWPGFKAFLTQEQAAAEVG